MASISLTPLANVTSTGGNAVVFTDLHLDLQVGYTFNNQLYKTQQIQDVQADTNLGAIYNSIASIITTTPGQKILNPVFGIGLGDILFLPCTVQRANTIGTAIYQAITTYEPRVQVVNVNVYPNTDTNTYQISINVVVPAFGTQQVTLIGTLDKSGFFLNN